jgi:hypothetical protein
VTALTSHEKALKYLGEGRVKVRSYGPSEAAFIVHGTKPYVVRFFDGAWSCNCPAAMHEKECAHLIACAKIVDFTVEEKAEVEGFPPQC